MAKGVTIARIMATSCWIQSSRKEWMLSCLLCIFWVSIDLKVSAAEGPIFKEKAGESGLNFEHVNGMSGSFYIPEEMGPGCAFLDYDRDGDLDVYVMQGGPLGPGKTMKDAIFPPKQKGPLVDRLFRNEGVTDKGLPRFTDVTLASGLHAAGYGMGVAVGDVDGDGFDDLYLNNFGPNQLWRNRGDGTFENISLKAGVADPSWSVSASFFDADGDGDLDLYVANYLEYPFSAHKACLHPSGIQEYCGPNSYKDASDRFYRNRGNGTFDDESEKVGVLAASGSGLGVISGDFNRDGLTDVYVANDADANFMWMGQRDQRFVNEALLNGAAYNVNGKTEAGMGVALGDFDGDGDEDLIVTHLTNESHTLYQNMGKGLFEDRTVVFGLGAATMEATGFGVAWIDVDLDGWLDLFVVNGTVMLQEHLLRKKDPYPLHQPNQLFRNLKGKRFVEVNHAGLGTPMSHVSRGAAFGDVDNDGDRDILIANNQGPVRLLLNQVGNRNSWVGFQLKNSENHPVVGARIEVKTQAGRRLYRSPRTDGSFASANDPRVIFGLGQEKTPLSVTVTWPDGQAEDWNSLEADRYHLLSRGNGKEAKP